MIKISQFLRLSVLTPALFGADTTLLYNPASPAVGPFPSDALTVADQAQKTGKRINLPAPANCQLQPVSGCLDTMLLNQLDGFSVAPRIQVCFDQHPSVGTIPNGLFVFALNRPGQRIGVTQVFYDPDTKCAYAKPQSILQQSTPHLLLATNDIRDAEGKQVKPSKDFKDCLKGGDASCSAMVQALTAAVGPIPADDRYIGATVFTTLSASAWLEKARDFVNHPQTPVGIMPLGTFPLVGTTFVFHRQVNVNGTTTPWEIPTQYLLPHVGRVGFGLLLSPNFIAVSGSAAGSIPQLPTNMFDLPSAPSLPGMPPGFIPVGVHVWLPATPKPPNGYPFAIYGHGLTDDRFGATTAIAATNAQNGIATVALEIHGHGGGPNGFVLVNNTIPLPAPGRGISVSPDGSIGPLDGCILPGPIATRDCTRQSTVDAMALLRAIPGAAGAFGELDPSKASIIGQSFGSMFGAIASALDPRVKTVALNVAGGSPVTIAKLQQFHPVAIFYLGARVPSLLNQPFGFPNPLNYDFDDNHVFRNQAPATNTVPGAPQIQAAFEVADWLNMPGDPLAYAAGLSRLPAMVQFAYGDWEVPNPANSAFIRAAGLRERSRFFRFDLAQAAAPSGSLPIQPHRFLANGDILASPAQFSIAMAAQRQIAGFLNSGGAVIPDANAFLTPPFAGMTLFETPSVLPESLNFVRLPVPPPAP